MTYKQQQAIIAQKLPVSPLAKEVLHIINLDKCFFTTYYDKVTINCHGCPFDEIMTIEENSVDFLYRSQLAHIDPTTFAVTVEKDDSEITVTIKPMTLKEFCDTIPMNIEIEIFNNQGQLIMDEDDVHNIDAIVDCYGYITSFNACKDDNFVYIDLLDIETQYVQMLQKSRFESSDIYKLDLPPEIESKLLNHDIKTIKKLKELSFGELIKIVNIYDIQTITLALNYGNEG